MNIQDAGGLRKTVEWGSGIIREMLPEANRAERSDCPARELTLALQCGGSDAYPGITANPALGEAANLLVRHAGTAVLSQTPEIYRAEHLLTRRAADREVGDKLIERIRWREDHPQPNGRPTNNNPPPRQPPSPPPTN